jgi:hypothetical protein
MNKHRLLIVALVCMAPLVAAAQWQWIDKDGKKVFSDRPPSFDPANRILKQPAGGGAPAAADTPTASGAAAPAAGGAPASTVAGQAASGAVPKLAGGTDKGLEEKKKQAEAAEAAKKKAEEEKFAMAKAENCKRAQQSKSSLDSGHRLAKVNDKGEKDFLSDQERASEMKRVTEVIARDCK